MRNLGGDFVRFMGQNQAESRMVLLTRKPDGSACWNLYTAVYKLS